MSNYSPLLELLMEKGTATFDTTVTPSALRKGLNLAVKKHNTFAAIMEEEEFTKSFTISTVSKGEGTQRLKVTVVDSIERGKFSFNIVEDT